MWCAFVYILLSVFQAFEQKVFWLPFPDKNTNNDCVAYLKINNKINIIVIYICIDAIII